MAVRQILSCGTLLALAVLAGLLPAKGNVAAGQRALQREQQLGESGGGGGPPEVVSINDNGAADYLEEPWSDYSIKSRINDVAGVDALINYLLQARRMRSAGSYNDNQLQLNRAQKKKSYWKQCAFNAVSCFG